MRVSETERQTETQRQMETDRDRDRETERQRESERQTDRETERQRERDRDPSLASLCIAHLEYCAIARVIFDNYTGAGHMVQRETNGVLTRVNLGPPVKAAS